jgi:hypothetical protein
MQLEIGECHESVNDALQSAVTALGGFKKAGAMLRPELPIDQAAGWLRDCLNPGKREKLSPDQFLFIMRAARAGGYHALMNFVAFDTGYRAAPVDPQTQEAELQRRFIECVDVLAGIKSSLERVQRVRAVP